VIHLHLKSMRVRAPAGRDGKARVNPVPSRSGTRRSGWALEARGDDASPRNSGPSSGMVDSMILTERQAKRSMWCPMVRIRWMNVWQASNRSNPGRWNRVKNALFRTFFPRLHWLARAKFFRCWGSGCMMWRWADRDAKTGFCGLAGNPLQNLFSD
jgi:hypothetical protein